MPVQVEHKAPTIQLHTSLYSGINSHQCHPTELYVNALYQCCVIWWLPSLAHKLLLMGGWGSQLRLASEAVGGWAGSCDFTCWASSRLIMDPVNASFSVHIWYSITASENIRMLECDKVRGFPVDFLPMQNTIAKYHRLGGKVLINNRHLFLTVLEAEIQCSSKGLLQYPHMAERGWESSFASSYKGANTIHEAPIHEAATLL